MNIRQLVTCLAAAWLAGLFLAPAGQAQSGKITGRVVDRKSGDPLPGVNVVVKQRWSNGEAVSLSQPRGAATNADGYYTILNVSPGTYNVQASYIGFVSKTKTKAAVRSGLTTTLNFEMAEEVVEGEEVRVVAEQSIVRPDVSSTVEYISPERIQAAPTNRVDEFMDNIKGVELVSNEEGSGLSIRGGSIRETDVRLNGISLRDPRSGNSYLSFNTATIEEIQVKTGGFEARYGGIQSGLVNVVTKEGSRDRFTATVRADVTPAGQKHYFGTGLWEKGSLIQQVYGGSYALGGVPDEAIRSEDNPDAPIPDEDLFRFRGWSGRRTGVPGLTGEENRALWRARHPVVPVADEPDYFIESAFTGPFFLPKTTFLLGARYERTQFAFPLGPRDNYTDWNTQLKLTTRFTPRTKLSANAMYAKISTINSGQTSSFGGALSGKTDRFNFLTNSSAAIGQQANLIAGSSGFLNTFNRGRTQYYDKRAIVGGLKLTHSFSSPSFMEVQGQFSYNDNLVRPFYFNTDEPGGYLSVGDQQFLNLPERGLPNGEATGIADDLGYFRLAGGAGALDSSYTWTAALRTDYTRQFGQHHELQTGFDFRYDHLFVYSGVQRSDAFSYEPGFFQYYTATPLQLALYAQDKLEFQGMVATVGLRAEYFNPMKDGFEVDVPPDEDFGSIFNEVYSSLPGELNSFERWKVWRDLLDEPPGWPKKDTGGKFRLSPRIGTSFPITTSSKLYLNFGLYYQRPKVPFMYNETINPGAVNVPAPGLDPERTLSFEFGFEQSIFNNYLINPTFYYKDVQNLPLSVRYEDYYERNLVTTYENAHYRDVRGLEVRLEKTMGRFVTFWANYDYRVVSSGDTGLDVYDANPLEAREQQRFPSIVRQQPRPEAHANLNLHTPGDFGPDVLGLHPFGGFSVNPLYEWRDGGFIRLNPDASNPDLQQRLDRVNYSNVDLRASKSFDVSRGDLKVVMTVKNLLNTKRLNVSNMLPGQRTAYMNSLQHKYKGTENRGDDLYGEYQADHIDTGWYTAPLFLNPRRVQFGVRYSF